MVADLHFEIQRNKTHLFVDLKESASVAELKKHIEHVLNIPADDITLVRADNYRRDLHTVYEDKKTLTECGFNINNAKAQSPAILGMIVRGDDGLQIEPLSQPPPVPDVMRQEGHAE